MNLKSTLISLFFLFATVEALPQETLITLSEEKMISKSKKILSMIHDNNYNKILVNFPADIRRNIPKSELIKYVNLGKEMIDQYGIPDDNFITKRLFLQPISKQDTLTIIYYDVPFPQPKEKYSPAENLISIGFLEGYGEDKIVSLQVRPNAYAPPIQKPDIPIISKLENLNVKHVKAYRVYYSGGSFNKNRFGNNTGVFALQGRNSELLNSDFKNYTQKLFTELSNIELPDPKIFTGFIKKEGRPEFIQAEYMLGDLKYGIRIFINLQSEKKHSETTNGKIVIRQMQFANLGYEYILEQENYPEIIQIFKKIRDKDWGKEYLINP